jgi:hypothetical protein
MAFGFLEREVPMLTSQPAAALSVPALNLGTFRLAQARRLFDLGFGGEGVAFEDYLGVLKHCCGFELRKRIRRVVESRRLLF